MTRAVFRPNPELFWRRVDTTDLDGCWLWRGFIKSSGYGLLTFGGRRGTKKTSVNAHRVAWTISHGNPGEFDVLHRCDNRRCVNPSHLFLGTHADNMADMIAKKRNRPCPGEKNGNRKMTLSQVEEIRGSSLPSRALAASFVISMSAVWRIRTGRTWVSP
jgi:hypothetical protein